MESERQIWASRAKLRLLAIWRHTGSDESVSDRYSKTIQSPLPPDYNQFSSVYAAVMI